MVIFTRENGTRKASEMVREFSSMLMDLYMRAILDEVNATAKVD